MSSLGPSPRLLAPVAVAALLLVLSGCGKDDPSAAPATDPTTLTDTPTTSQTPTQSESPSQTPSTSASASASPTLTQLPDPSTLLLPAAGMPGFNATWHWSAKATGRERGPFGICQRFAMQTIGADKTVVRRYTPTGDLRGATGAHLVASFVDEKSADQAIAVLRTWHDHCREQLDGYAFKRVGPVTPVSTHRGNATWYLVTYTKKGAEEGRFDALGVLRSGSTVELLRLDLNGADYDYPPGREPMVNALRRAADRLP